VFWRRRHLVDSAEIQAGLRELGLRPGGLVALHSSLSSLGWVTGGAHAVVSAFLDVLGPQGTLMAPAFTHCFAPKDGRHRARQGPFDRSHTPSSVGRVSEAIRLWPGACRSFHPIHSASAIGPLASELTSGHESGSDFGPQSPFARLVKRRGLIVLLGVGQFCNSTVHVVEDMLGMPYLAQETALVLGPDGEPVPFTCRNCPSGHRDFYNRQGSKWDTAIQAAGVILHGRIGMARVQVMDAALFARAACEILRATPDLLLCDSPGCLFCSSAKRQLQTLGLRQAATQTAPAPES